MLWKWYNGTLVEIKDESPTVKRFFVKVEGDEDFDFEPGQFITLDLPISDKRLKRWRSYSIANTPNSDNIIELVIVRLEGGVGTEYLFETIDIGEKIKFKGPSGSFTLPDTIDKDIVLICTGTGVAPFRSMIQHIFENDIPHKKIHLIYGSRRKENILYKDELCDLNKTQESFQYSIALSQEKNWLGYKGYVHQIYKEYYPEQRDDVKFYICGWTEMVDEAVETLILSLGFNKNQIIYELYG